MQMPRAGLELNGADKQKLNQLARLPRMSAILSARNSVLFRLVPPRGAGSAIRRQRNEERERVRVRPRQFHRARGRSETLRYRWSFFVFPRPGPASRTLVTAT